METAEASTNSKESNQVKAKDVMEMSRSNFLDLLKGGGSTQEPSNSSSTTKKSSQAKKPESDEEEEEDEDDGLGATSWSVLKESYLTDKKLALKVELPPPPLCLPLSLMKCLVP